jgi:predicted transcriptional regulator
MGKGQPASDALTAILRKAIIESGESLKGLSKATGIERMSLSRFADGQRSLRLDKAGILADYFGLRLVKKG